jgi:hypothetical protein
MPSHANNPTQQQREQMKQINVIYIKSHEHSDSERQARSDAETADAAVEEKPDPQTNVDLGWSDLGWS